VTAEGGELFPWGTEGRLDRWKGEGESLGPGKIPVSFDVRITKKRNLFKKFLFFI